MRCAETPSALLSDGPFSRKILLVVCLPLILGFTA
jgi:hypothetical protein